MQLALLISFTICFLSGGMYFSNFKKSPTTWRWFLGAALCAIPSFIKVMEHVNG